jgi:signal transduction histidine kinase
VSFDDRRDDNPPVASSAAWDATAAPSQVLPLLNFDDPEILAALGKTPPPAAPEPEPNIVASVDAAPERPRIDRLAALRDIARKLRQAPDAEETLQAIIDEASRCTGSDAGMLTITQPEHRQVVCGSALGAGPYISVQLRAGGPSFGELVLTRLSDGDEYESEEETFAELVGEYVAKAVGALRRGTVLSDEQQDFLDRVTEEMRQPVASTGNFLKALLDRDTGVLNEEQRGYAAAAAQDVTRVLSMVEDLLALSRLRPPETREMESIPVTAWLRRVVREHDWAAKGRQIEIRLLEPAEPLVVKGVAAQLDTVLRQLLSNALKFTDDGGEIEVSAGMSEGMVRVTVKDNGIGFDPSDASRMLDCFARAINAEAGGYPGMGVGLFLAAEIMKNHSGRVWLDTQRDEGTQAHFALMPSIADQRL